MKYNNLGNYSNINTFVESKLHQLQSMKPDFTSLFSLMFSEQTNILFERSNGYRIEKTTYGEAYHRILRLSNSFKKQTSNLPYNSVIGLYMDNSLSWILAFWMILKSGYRPLLMNLRLSDATLAEALASCNVQLVVSDGKQFSVPTIVFNDISELTDVPSIDCPFGSEILVMSSGTSDHLKICAYSAEEFVYQIEDSYHIICQCQQIKRHYEGELKLLTFLPFYHIFGLVAVYIWFSFFSRTFVQLNDFSPQTVLNTIRRHRVTHIFAVPMFWNRVYSQAIKTIHDRGEQTEKKFLKGLAIAQKLGDVPLIGHLFCQTAFREVRENLFGDSICFMITGGSEIREEVLQFFNSIGYHLANGYGMTEIGITSVELSAKKKIRNSGFVGKPLSSVEYSINPSGELLVRGRSIAKYILEDGNITTRDDWFNTHDLAECVHGHYRILGRKDDLIISSSGENLNPNLIEPQLDIAGVRELCLIGLRESDRIVPCLIASVDKMTTEEEANAILSALKNRLLELKLSSSIGKILLTSDPLIGSSEFKLNRSHIARDCQSGKLAVLDPVAFRRTDNDPDDELMNYLKELFAVALGKNTKDISSQADFFLDEGGTSLDYFAIISKIQEDYSIAFPTAADRSLNSIQELYNYIKAAVSHD